MVQAKVSIEIFGQKVDLPFLVEIPDHTSIAEVDFATLAFKSIRIEAEEFIEPGGKTG